MMKILCKVLKSRDLQPHIKIEISKKEKLESQLNMLLDKLLEGVISDELYRKKQVDIEQQLKIANEKIKKYEEEVLVKRV